MSEFEIVGKRIPGIYSSSKALGDFQYLDDIKIGGALYGKVLRSPLPHARILHIDISRAKYLKDVKTIITGQDLPNVKFSNYPTWGSDRYALAIGKVRHAGEAVAAVAAIDEELAQEALELIKVDYEPLPYLFDAREAIQPDAVLIHENKDKNISNRFVIAYGDIEKGFREADYVREDTFTTVPNNHAAIEPHGTICKWNSDGSITIWANTQGPFRLRGQLNEVLGLTQDKLRIIKTGVGGGFGGKTGALDIHVIAAHLSRMTGKPVKIVLSREEVFLCTHQRHPVFTTVRTGVKKNGIFTGQEIKTIVDGGAYTGSGTISLHVGARQSMINYIIPHFRYEGMRVFTNKPIGGPMRGHGSPQVSFSVESQIDILARELGIDPVDFRLKNFTYVGYDHPAKKRISSCGLKEAVTEVARILHWHEKKEKLADGYGLGFACSNFTSGPKSFPHAHGGIIIEINMEGGIIILSGAADIGQGTDTVICQIVAEELGVRMEDIRIIVADTAITPFDMGTMGSGVTFRVGNAALKAARDVKQQLLEVLSLYLEAPPEKIKFSGRKIQIEGYPERTMSFKEAIKAYHYAGKTMPLVGRGSYEPDCALGEEEGPDTPYAFYCQGVEVKVDKDTGEVKILKLVTAADCGKAINPLNVEGQAEGAMIGGMSMALYESLPFNEGKYLNANLMDYLIPTAMDSPWDLPSLIIETNDPFGPLGAKEAGEGMLISISPAIANAIQDAVGLRLTDLPITPDKIKKAMEFQNIEKVEFQTTSKDKGGF